MIFARSLVSALAGVFHYSGRSDRLEHWTFCFLTALMGLLAWALVDTNMEPSPALAWTTLVAVLWLGLAHVALFVRRLHDHGRSGLWLLPTAAGVFAMLIGWAASERMLGSFQPYLSADHGYWVIICGRAIVSLSVVGVLLPVFVGQGDLGENEFGDPVE